MIEDRDGNDVQAHTASILLRQVGTAINRILESGEAVSRVKALVAAGERPERAEAQAQDDYAMFAEPFRRFGASYVTRGYAYKSIEQEVEAITAKLLRRFGSSWRDMTGDRDLLTCLLARPVNEALWEAQKIIAESTEVRPSGAKERKEARSSAMTRAKRALENPDKYPNMTAEEVQAIMGIGRSTVYDLLNKKGKLEKVSTGARRWLVTTESVRNLRDSSPD